MCVGMPVCMCTVFVTPKHISHVQTYHYINNGILICVYVYLFWLCVHTYVYGCTGVLSSDSSRWQCWSGSHVVCFGTAWSHATTHALVPWTHYQV